RLAVECLSGGMSGRLFDRIREKQGLCYSVYAGYTSMPVPCGDDFASVFAYAGTSNERAQQTLDALVHELRDIASGVTPDELHRAKIGLKAGTVMSGESSSARAGGLARDWLSGGRCRTLDEIVAAVDAIDLDRLNTWLAAHPATGFTVVQIGPRELAVPAS
ncbi:MAG: insulinase family protein, partial [Planctomycetota bacterium]